MRGLSSISPFVLRALLIIGLLGGGIFMTIAVQLDLFYATAIKYITASWWEYYVASRIRTGSAPLSGCDSPNTIPGEYIVGLWAGYRFADHNLSISDVLDLNQANARIIFEFGNVMYAANLDDKELAAVRADRVVQFVECNARVHVEPTMDKRPTLEFEGTHVYPPHMHDAQGRLSH